MKINYENNTFLKGKGVEGGCNNGNGAENQPCTACNLPGTALRTDGTGNEIPKVRV